MNGVVVMRQASKHLTIMGHLEELRQRFTICIIALGITTAGSFLLVDKLREIMIRPAGQIQLVFITPPEAFLADLRLAIMFGLALALPILVYQILAFVLPAFESYEKKLILPVVIAVIVFFILGVLFAYFILFPFSVRFFLTFASDTLQPMFTVSNYLAFAVNFIFTFGLVFQMPLLFFLLGSFNLVEANLLRRCRKYALLVVLILAAVLTPPDVVSQLMMGLPLYGLYELGILLVAASKRREKKQKSECFHFH